MKIHAVHFGDSNLCQRLAKVLAFSAQKNSPNTPLTIHTIADVDWRIPKRGFTSHDAKNALKTKFHNQIIQSIPDGELVCMMDLDMVVLQDLTPAFEGEFDLCYTVRKQKSRINSGVIFVKVSPKMKAWYQRWQDTVWELLNDAQLCIKMKQKYSGINQSALGMMLLQPHDLVLKELPALIWNCTPIHYPKFGPETRVLHLLNNAKALDSLRDGKRSIRKTEIRVAKAWVALEEEMLAQEKIECQDQLTVL